MAEQKLVMRVVVNDAKSGKSFQRELAEEKEGLLIGKKIGEKLEGGVVGLPGYTLQITGGSDVAGFPMRKDVPGQKRVKVVLGSGAGVRIKRKGEKRKKLVVGSIISAQTMQVNAKIVDYGQQSLEELGFVSKAGEEKKQENK